MAMDDLLDISNHCPLRASLVDNHYSTGLNRLPTHPTLEDFTCLFSAVSTLSFKAAQRYFHFLGILSSKPLVREVYALRSFFLGVGAGNTFLRYFIYDLNARGWLTGKAHEHAVLLSK